MSGPYSLEATAYPPEEPESVTAHLVGVLTEVANERAAQDLQHGGPAHDDTHRPLDWFVFLYDHVGRLVDCGGATETDYRERLAKIAAIAAAAAQAWDRAHAPDASWVGGAS